MDFFTDDALVFLLAGITVMVIGVIFNIIWHFDAYFMYGWACCDIFIAFYHKNDIFYHKDKLPQLTITKVYNDKKN